MTTTSDLLDPAVLEKSSQFLDQMLAKQFRLQERLGTWERVQADAGSRQQFINQMVLALMDEVMETLGETQWKNPAVVPFGWKKTQEMNLEKFKAEIIDQLHFWLALAIVAGFRSGQEILDSYMGKNKENHTRQDHGY